MREAAPSYSGDSLCTQESPQKWVGAKLRRVGPMAVASAVASCCCLTAAGGLSVVTRAWCGPRGYHSGRNARVGGESYTGGSIINGERFRSPMVELPMCVFPQTVIPYMVLPSMCPSREWRGLPFGAFFLLPALHSRLGRGPGLGSWVQLSAVHRDRDK